MKELEDLYRSGRTGGSYKCDDFTNDEWYLLDGALRYLKNKGLIEARWNASFAFVELTDQGMDYLDGVNDQLLINPVFNIGAVNAPSVIGTQQNVTQNNGATLEDIEKIILTLPVLDQKDLVGLVEILKNFESGKKTVKKGALSKYADTLLKYLPLANAVGSLVIKVLTIV
jgi:hypothetical protein